MKTPAHGPVGHRYPCAFRDSDCRGHAGHCLIGNPVFFQGQDFLPAAAEHKGVPAFQPYHGPA